VISILTLLIVIAASRPVNKNVTGAVIRAKPCIHIEPSVRKLQANYQTGGYKFRPMSGWNEESDRSIVSEHTH